MYTNIKNVQILISLLKQFNIRHVIVSPGTRNTALAHSIEQDEFFYTYSIVDERSAGYFALGISEALDVPVCISCTAATATCNYAPAIKEAYERNIQLIALTADQDSYGMFHNEDQCIDQVDMFHEFVRYAVDIPMVNNDRDYWYANRRINEALLELNHHGKGPVQINYRMVYTLEELSTFDVKDLPVTRKIQRYEGVIDWKSAAKELEGKKRILIFSGSDYIHSTVLKEALEQFVTIFNCVVIGDTFANCRTGSDSILLANTLGDVINFQTQRMLKPDLIISFGNVYYSTLKTRIANYSDSVEHWQIAVDGMLNDGFRCLKRVYECRPETFFESVSKFSNSKNNGIYGRLWRKSLKGLKYPDLGFTNFAVIKKICSMIPENSILHTSVLDAIRISNYVDMDPTVRCFANIGADGIDGALSAFLGQAETDDKLAFLIIGDLSFLYDMNALLGNLTPNIRILVINNYAGAEFHKNFGRERIPTIDNLVSAGHNTKIQQCSGISNAIYLSAGNDEELNTAFEMFVRFSNNPMILEVFTDAHYDAEKLKEYWAVNKMPELNGVKNVIKKVIGQNNWEGLKKLIR